MSLLEVKEVSVSGGLPLLGRGKVNLNEIYDSPTNQPPSDFALPQPVPRLVMAQSSNVTAVQGRAALLNCRVRGIGNRTVRLELTSVSLYS